MKTTGWMVNLTMRRVEPVTAEESYLNRGDYGRYRGPKRTYMLHDNQVFDTELEAMQHLRKRMLARHEQLSKQLYKYGAELASVWSAVVILERMEPKS